MEIAKLLLAAPKNRFNGSCQAIRPFGGNLWRSTQFTPVIRQGFDVGDLIIGMSLVEWIGRLIWSWLKFHK